MKQPIQVTTEAGEVKGMLKGVSGVWLLLFDGKRYFLIKSWIMLRRLKNER